MTLENDNSLHRVHKKQARKAHLYIKLYKLRNHSGLVSIFTKTIR